jgi:glycosyltransferase involved in cell wall biosynthesis
MQSPLVSVSLVAYNAEAYIRDAIEGCLMQEVDFEYEILIHDDASSDNTPEIIKEYANKFPGLIVPIIQTENQFSKGKEINAHIIIPQARGKYIAFLEADDYWIDPDKLTMQTHFMESHPDVAMCFTATKHIFPLSSRKPRLKRYRKYDTLCSVRDVILKGGRLVDMASAVVRSSVFDDVPEWYHYAQIWDKSVPLLSLLHGNIYYFDKVTSVYRYNVPGSWTSKNKNNFDRRKANLMRSMRLADGFDNSTNYQYHNFIERLNQLLSVEVLLLTTSKDEDYQKYYARLNMFHKVEYKIFKYLGSFRLWERYRQIRRLVVGF